MKFAKFVQEQTKKNRKADQQRAIANKLSGKDYLSQAEAAAYTCVSIRQFRKIAPTVGLFPFKFGGRLVYRRVDCIKAMEAAHG